MAPASADAGGEGMATEEAGGGGGDAAGGGKVRALRRRGSSLEERVRDRLIRFAGSRATKDGVIVIEANRHRTQERNRADARERLTALLARAAEPPPPPRKKTRPSKGAVERRLKAKAGRAGVKKMRGKPGLD